MTLQEIEERFNAIAGQSLSTTEGDSDWTLRRSYINRAQQDWSERFDWPELYTETNSLTSQGSALASIAMPANFRKLAGFPEFAGTQYPVIDAFARRQYSTDSKYCYLLGSLGNYTLVVNPATFASGTSIFIPFTRTPNSLISGSDVADCPNGNYIVQQALFYHFSSQEDARFQSFQAEAERILATLFESSQIKGPGYDSRVKTQDETKYGFRWGRDG